MAVDCGFARLRAGIADADSAAKHRLYAAFASSPFMTCCQTWAIDTTTPSGRLMFQVTGAFAEFERSMIRQRVHAGLKRAVAQGKQLGRPRISAAVEKRIQDRLRAGMCIIKVAREVGVGNGAAQRVQQEMKGPFVGMVA